MATLARLPRLDVPDLPADVALMNATAALFALLGGLALAVTLLVVFVRQPMFSLRAIAIEGEVTRNSVTTIRANAAPQLAGNFFTLDLASVRRAFESVPWVRRAVVHRIWPNRLRVQLEEHRPVALWAQESGNDRLVNNFGEVFEANLGDVEDDPLPTLQGPEGSSAQVLALYRRLTPVFAQLGAQIDTLALSARGSWRLELDSGAEVQLGRGREDEVVARSERFVGTLTQVLAQHQRPLEYADLRHNDGYAVRLQGVSTTPDAPDSKPKKK